jgi:hypothetical protein
MIGAVLAILSLTVCLWQLTPGAGAVTGPGPFLTPSKSEREPATPTELAVDSSNNNNDMNNDKNINDNNTNKASRVHDAQPTTTTKATASATTLTTTKATTSATTSATRMRQQRLSRRHRSLVFTNLFAWIKKIFCYVFGQKFGFCSPPTPTCRTGPNAFTTRQQLDDALAEFFTNNGYTANLQQQYGANMNEWDVSAITDFSYLFDQRGTFNEVISCWNVGAGTNFEAMFDGATNFNQDIGQWNVGAGTDFSFMFDNAINFNQDIGRWNVGAGTDFAFMFSGANAFNQNLCAWGVKMQSTDFVLNMFAIATMCANKADPAFPLGGTPGPFCANCN